MASSNWLLGISCHTIVPYLDFLVKVGQALNYTGAKSVRWSRATIKIELWILFPLQGLLACLIKCRHGIPWCNAQGWHPFQHQNCNMACSALIGMGEVAPLCRRCPPLLKGPKVAQETNIYLCHPSPCRMKVCDVLWLCRSCHIVRLWHMVLLCCS